MARIRLDKVSKQFSGRTAVGTDRTGQIGENATKLGFRARDDLEVQQLAVALSQGVTAILGAFAPAYAVIGQVATAILQAMPAGWFANDDDYVDSFYTLEKARYYTGYAGARGNVTVSLTPYVLQ